MIQEGSRVVLQNDKAIYQTAEVMNINNKTITIRYCQGCNWDSNEQRPIRKIKTEVINRKDIVRLSERW